MSDVMDVQILLEGVDITDKVISYTREQKICTGIGMFNMVTTPAMRDEFKPWDHIVLYEKGDKVGSYYVSTWDDSIPDANISVVAQDNSKRLTDYFIKDTYIITYPTYALYWITLFLTEMGITYDFVVKDDGSLLSNNTQLGMMSGYEQIMQLLQISGWYIKFKPNDKAVVGKLDTALGAKATIKRDDLIEVKVVTHDKLLRNRVVVWGKNRPGLGWVTAEAKKITKWNYDAKDYRTLVISNSCIPTTNDAYNLAYKALAEFTKPNKEIHVTAAGTWGASVGDFMGIRSGSSVFNGKGLVTTYGSTMSDSGLVTNITLNERCPRLFAFFDFGDYVYIGTAASGIARKNISYFDDWHDFSSGLMDMRIADLHISAGAMGTVTAAGECYVTNSDNDADSLASGDGNGWMNISLSGLTSLNPTETFSGFKGRAVIVDRMSNVVKFAVDNGYWETDLFYNPVPALLAGVSLSGASASGNPLANPWAGLASYIVETDAISGIMLAQIPVVISYSGYITPSGIETKDVTQVAVFDIENDGETDYLSILAKRPSVFYVNTVDPYFNTYLTGVDLFTGTVVSRVAYSGLVWAGASGIYPERIYTTNVGNIISSSILGANSGKIFFLDNGYVTGVIPTNTSGEYGFGTADIMSTGSGYVSLQGIPSGVSIPYHTETAGCYYLTDTLGQHEAVGMNGTVLDVIDYDFTAASGFVNRTVKSIKGPLGADAPLPIKGFVWKCSENIYQYLSGKDIITVNTTASGSMTKQQVIATGTPNLTFEFANNNKIYLTFKNMQYYVPTYGFQITQKDETWLNIIDLAALTFETKLIYSVQWFPGYEARISAVHVAQYTTDLVDTYQVIGFEWGWDSWKYPQTTPRRFYSIASIGGIGQRSTPLAVGYPSYDSLAYSVEFLQNFVKFSRKYSCAYFNLYNGLSTPQTTIMNFGAYGVVLAPDLKTYQAKPGQALSYPWEDTDGYFGAPPGAGTGTRITATAIQDGLFDNYSIITDPTGLYIASYPFQSKGFRVNLWDDTVGSRAFIHPESDGMFSLMTVERQSDNTFIPKIFSSSPLRLDISKVSPMLVATDKVFSLMPVYISQSDLSQIVLSGSTNSYSLDTLTDFRYTDFTLSGINLSGVPESELYDDATYSGLGIERTILFTTAAGLFTAPIDDIGNNTLVETFSGITQLEVTNNAYNFQYVFVATSGAGEYHFYQKDNNPSGIFIDYPSGLPQSPVTRIRVDDMV